MELFKIVALSYRYLFICKLIEATTILTQGGKH
jgi:hypothetical protein